MKINQNSDTLSAAEIKNTPALAAAREMILQESVSCVIIRDNEIVYTGNGRGVKPLLHVYESDPKLLQGAILADKIIGKAAAMIAVLGGVRHVFAVTMSSSAREYLAQHGISCSSEHEVDAIHNRTGDGLCPLEQSVLKIEEPEAGYLALKATIRELMANR